jgi:hypothetical protein
MDKYVHLETSLKGELAELYSGLLEEMEAKSSVSLAEINRTFIQTGMIHHLLMLKGLGVIQGQKADELERLAQKIGQDSILWDVFEILRQHWQKNTGGGSIDVQI